MRLDLSGLKPLSTGAFTAGIQESRARSSESRRQPNPVPSPSQTQQPLDGDFGVIVGGYRALPLFPMGNAPQIPCAPWRHGGSSRPRCQEVWQLRTGTWLCIFPRRGKHSPFLQPPALKQKANSWVFPALTQTHHHRA